MLGTFQLHLVTKENIYIVCDFFCRKSIAAVHVDICIYMHYLLCFSYYLFTYVNEFKVNEIKANEI